MTTISRPQVDVARPRARNRTKVDRLSIEPARRTEMELVAGFVRSSASWYRPIVVAEDIGEHDVDGDWGQRNFEIREFFVGRLNGEPFGTVSVQTLGGYAYVGYVYLDVAFCGRGLGQRLLAFAAREARRRGLRGLALIAHPEAVWATRAYLKFGFTKVGSEPADVLRWAGGALQPYYEQGFELYLYDL